MPAIPSFTVKRIRFDENYSPAQGTRLTTNFANLARGEARQQNLRNTLRMINNRFNTLAAWDNPDGSRYAIELDILSIDLDIDGSGKAFPAIEFLETAIIDSASGRRLQGIVGNNFSSYIRDYDFSVLLPKYNRGSAPFRVPADFGGLHGKLFQTFVSSDAYRAQSRKLPVICLSVSHNIQYRRITNHHPILGFEYEAGKASLTEIYFRKMGMSVRYFLPLGSAAPLAFYFFGDILSDYTNIELIATIATMETFQKIYRPEIYNANSRAGEFFQPSLDNCDHSLTGITYDREERSRLAVEQGQFAEIRFIRPYRAVLEDWSARCAA